MWGSSDLLSTRGKNCLPTSMKTQRRETCRTRTVLMRWRTTANWWTEMYVPCLVFSSTLPLFLLFLPGLHAGFVSLCPAHEMWIVRVFPVLSSGYGVFSSSTFSLLLLLISCISAVCVCLFLSVWLFVLISCSSSCLSLLLLFNWCLLFSKWKVMNKKLILSHLRSLTQSCAIFSHPNCESLRW